MPESGVSKREELDSANAEDVVIVTQSGGCTITLAASATHDRHEVDGSKTLYDEHLTDLEVVETVIDSVRRSALADVEQLAKQQLISLSRR